MVKNAISDLKYFAHPKKQVFVRIFRTFWYQSTRKNLEYENWRRVEFKNNFKTILNDLLIQITI